MDTFQLFAECIRTEQVPQEDVSKFLARNPEFASWYIKEIEKCQVNPPSKLE